MADPGRTQQGRPGAPVPRPGTVPAGTVPGRSAGAPPGWAPGAPAGQRYQGQPPGAPYYTPRPGAPGQARQGAPPGAVRGPVPNGAPGTRPRPADPTRVGAQRPRPPAGPVARQGANPPTQAVPQQGKQPKRVLVRDVQSRRVLRRFDVWSVCKVSFIFYLCVLVVLIAAGVVLWNVAAAFGVITSLDKLVRSLFALKSFRLHPMSALIWGSAVGALLCLLGVLVNVIAAVFYNLISDLVGGIQVVALSDKDR